MSELLQTYWPLIVAALLLGGTCDAPPLAALLECVSGITRPAHVEHLVTAT